MSKELAVYNLRAACREAERMIDLMRSSAAIVGDDPCADERALVALATGVRDAAANTLTVAEAAKTLAEMALMECESNNG